MSDYERASIRNDNPWQSFTYLTVDKAELYRAIIELFAVAKSEFVLHLRPAEIHSQFVHAGGDCLYRVERPALAGVLGSVRGAWAIEAWAIEATTLDECVEKLNATEIPEPADAQNRAMQHALVRRLLDDPVMYFDELTPREYEYWNGQAERLLGPAQK